MEKIVIRTSRIKAVLLTLVSIAFVAGGFFILLSSKDGAASRRGVPAKVAGWGAIVFFGGCSLVGFMQVLDSCPRLVIDDEGVFDRTLRSGKIPWTDIMGARLQTISSQPFICLDLRDEERYLAAISPTRRALVAANRALGFSAFSLNLSQVDADPQEVFELVSRRIRGDTGFTKV
jgi:hypothetical protein